MSLELSIDTDFDKDIAIITTKGELDDYNAPHLNDLFMEIIDQKKYIKLLVNLEETTYVDSVGLGTIAIAAKKVAALGGQLNIVCIKPQVIKLLDASGMVSMIKRNIGVFDDLTQAKEAMKV
jgi:anti-anti-sigma factor